MSKVAISRVSNIKNTLIKVLDDIGGLSNFIDKQDRIMLKPNLNGLEGFTNKDLTESLIQLLFDYGAADVFIAESTFGDANMTDMFFYKTGYLELAKKYNIEIVNLNRSEAIELKIDKPLITDSILIAKEVVKSDKIINLPNMKVHYATGVTLAMKNLKGLLVGDEKKRFHEIGLEKAIVDLNNTIKAHLHIIDCISCMEKMGPRGGDILELNLVIAGQNIAQVDYIGCKIMGFELNEVKHLQEFIRMNNIILNNIEVIGNSIDDVKYPFKKPKLESIVPNNINIHNKNACSACMNAVLLSCQLLQANLQKNVDIYLGELLEFERKSDSLSIAFGNCCPKNAHFDKVIKGCPPYPFTLGEQLKDILR